MALTLLRHAPLHPQYHKRYNGWTNLPIDPALFEKEKVALLQREHFDMVYSSDLQRCTQTLEQMGIKTYITDARLREVRFKAPIEGKSFEEITHLPSYHPSLLEDSQIWHTYLCAESQERFEARLLSFLKILPPQKEILLCSHGGTLQKIMHFLTHSSNHKIDYLDFIRIEHYDIQSMV